MILMFSHFKQLKFYSVKLFLIFYYQFLLYHLSQIKRQYTALTDNTLFDSRSHKAGIQQKMKPEETSYDHCT